MSSNTWRQYGGTRKQNQFHNLTIGTLVADQVLLRESYAGKFKIPGSIFVGADVNAIGNVYAFSSSITTFDSYTGKNLYLKKNLYFGTDVSLADLDLLNHAYMAGNYANETIGVNTQNPTSSFDIYGANNSQRDILSVSSLSTQVRCVLGQNVNKCGIALNATDDNASLLFYVDNDLDYLTSPDAAIRYVRGGNMNYSAANNNITSSINTNITSFASTFLTAQTLTNITSGQNVTINTKNTNILSRLYISNRGQPTNIHNESTVIYDISNGLYLHDAYENSVALAGSALTLMATDNNSNTFLRLLTPNNAGLSIAAGTYPNDTSRTINTLGLTDNTGKYRVNQTVVSGNSTIKYYTTTGFNTYAPRIDNYVMDINGPTHISNGEINQMAKFDYEVLKTSFSKTMRNFGIAVGTPSPRITVNSVTRNPQYISYTSDSGVTWTPVRVDDFGDFEQGQQKDFTVYTHDDKFAILGSATGALYYTKDGGKNWVNAVANDLGTDDYRRTYKTLFLNTTIINGKNRLFASVIREKGSIISPSVSELCIFYADLNLNSLPDNREILGRNSSGTSYIPYTLQNTSDTANNAFNETVVDVTMKNIYASDAANDSIYFVGTGINKYNMTTVTSQYLINTGNTYFGVHCYSNTYVVAVGATVTISDTVTATVISYTKNGTNWSNSTLPSGINLVRLRSVHLFDENNGMAVGDNGIFLYTKDGAVSWSVVPDSILNSSGYAARINGSYNKLRDIYMVDTNRMMVTSVKQSYVLGTSTPGLSKVYTCYLPNLYNAATNNIFDVSGNMTVSGNININDGGNLNTNCPAFNLINTSAQTVNFAGNATLINIGNNLPSQTNIKTNMDIFGNAVFRSKVDIQTDLALGGNLQVRGTGDSYIGGRLVINDGLNVTQKAVFNNDIYVKGNIEHELDFNYLNRLFVEQDAYLYQRVFIGGDAAIDGNLIIGKPVIIPSTVSTVNGIGTITLNNNMLVTINGKSVISGTFKADESAQLLEVGTSVSYGNLFPAGTTIASISKINPINGNTLVLIGNTYYDNANVFTNDILNGPILTLSQPPNSIPLEPINVVYQNSKTVSVYPDTSLNSRFYVGGDTSLNGRLFVANDVSLGGNINIGDNNTGVYANISKSGITYQANSVLNQYYNFPFTQFNFIQSLAEDVQNRLYDLTSRTNNISVTNQAPTNLQFVSSTTNTITFSFSRFLNANVTGYSIYVNGTKLNTTTSSNPYISASPTNLTLATLQHTISGLSSLTYYSIQVSAIVNGIDTNIKSAALIGGSTTRSFNIDDSGEFTDTIDPSTFDVMSIDPSMFGVDDTNFDFALQQFGSSVETSRDTVTTLLTFDVAGNNLLIAGALEPTTASNLSIGASNYPFSSMYVNSENAINFMSQNLANRGTMTFNLSTGYLDLSCNGLLGSTVLSYGGNVAIGKPLPSTNFDVLGQSIFNGNITQQTGNLFLNNRLFIQSDVSLVGNMFSGRNLYQTGDAFLNSRVFVLEDISLNSNLFVARDSSLNQRLYVGNDTSLNRNLFVGQTATINGNTLLNNQLMVQGVTILNSDVSLNSNIYINRKATINNDLSLNGNLTIDGFTFLNNDEYLQGNLFILGRQFLNGNIIINGFTNTISDVTMDSRLYVGGDVSINSRLFLTGLANFNNNVLMNGNAFIRNDLSLNGNLSIGGTKLIVSGDTSLNGNLFLNNGLYVNSDSTLNGNLVVNNRAFFNSDVTMNNRLFLAKDASFSSNVYINNKLITNNDLSINANIINSGKIITEGDISANSRLFVSGQTTLNTTLTVQGSTLLRNDLSVNANIFTNNLITASNSFVKGNIILNGDASFNSNLIVAKTAFIGGDTTMNGNLRVSNITNTGSMSTNGNNITFGDATIGSNLYVNRNATLNGSLAIGGDANVNGSVIVNNDVSLNGRIFVGSYPIGSIPIGAIAGGAGLALGSFAGDVNIGKNFYVGGETVLYGNLTVVKNLTLIGQLVIKQYTVNQTVTTLSYEIMIAQDLSLGGRLYMTGDASINGRVFIGEDVSMNSNLFVKGRSTFAQPITVGNSLTINGSVIENGQVTTNAQVTNNALNIFNADASLNARFYVGGSSNFISDVSMNNRLYVQHDSSLNGNFYAHGLSILNSDVSINNRLYVQHDSSLNGNFYAHGLSILNSDVSINNRLNVQNSTTIGGRLTLNGQSTFKGDVSMNTRLYVQNDASLNSNLYVARQSTLNGDVSMNMRLYVENDVSMSSNLYVARQSTLNGDVSMNTRLYVRNDASFGSNVYVNALSTFNGDVSMNNRLFVASDASVNGNFYVGGKTIFQRELSCNKVICGVDASFTGNIAIYGNFYLQTDFRFDSMYVKKNLSVQENVFIIGQMTQMVDASLSGNLNVMRDTSFNGRLAVSQDASFNRNINVIKDSSLNSRLFVGQDSSLNANLYVGNNTFIKGNFINNGDVSMVASLDLNGPMISRNNMNVYGIINQYSTNPTAPNTIVNNTSYVSSNASQVTLGTTSSQNVYVPGNIGIGTTNPLVPLYINKSSTSTGQDAGYYISNGSPTSTAINSSAAYIYSIYALNSIATSDKLIATSSVYFSDERIKKNIQDIDCSNALENIRQLKPKQYNYIDSIGQGSEPTLGFIAQEVKPIIKHSVSISKNFIPNIYELCKIENQVITLLNKTTRDLFVGSKIKAISRSGSELILIVSEINDEKTFLVDEYTDDDFSVDNLIFIYGQEIEDFNNLDKNAIFTITTAALKQVDMELQNTKKTVEQQKIQIKTLESQIKIINAKLQIF